VPRCHVCENETVSPGRVCAHHLTRDTSWAQANRLMCDLVHRGLVPPRPWDADEPVDWRPVNLVHGAIDD
jgi:hypothetical protein